MLGCSPPAPQNVVLLGGRRAPGLTHGCRVGAHAPPCLISELHLALPARPAGARGKGGGKGKKKLKHIKGVNKRLI